MRLSRLSRTTLGIVTGLILVIVYVPLFVVLVNSFSTSTSLTWPPPGFTLEWWGRAFSSAGAMEAVLTSVQIAIIAGTIFSFALSLGDYITVNIVGGANQMLGNLVYTNVGAANNLPLASAIALIPIVIIFGYLFLVRRTGALDNL